MFFLKIGLKDIQRAVLGSDLARFIQQGHLSSPSVLSLPLRSGHVPALPFRGGARIWHKGYCRSNSTAATQRTPYPPAHDS